MATPVYDRLARFYDLEHGDITRDLAFYERLAARTEGPILDAACGTGRVLLHLARQGRDCTGVDISGAMLDLAREEVRAEGLEQWVRLVRADLCGYQADRKHGLAFIALSGFLHLTGPGDQPRALRNLGAALTLGGLLALDLPAPDANRWVEQEQLLHDWTIPAGEGEGLLSRFSSREADLATQMEHVTLFYDQEDAEGIVRRTTVVMTFRHVFRYELELLLRQAGFGLESLFGGYEEEPFEAGSRRLIAVARYEG